MPHEVLGLNLTGLDALRLAVTIKRARDKFRLNEINRGLRDVDDKKDPLGVGRVITLIARLFVGD